MTTMNFIRYCDYCVDDASLLVNILSEDAPPSSLPWVATSELINLDHVSFIGLGEGKDESWVVYFKFTNNNHVTWPYKTKEQAIEAYLELFRTVAG